MNADEITQIKLLSAEISNLQKKKVNPPKLHNVDFTAKIEQLQQKRDEYLAALDELEVTDDQQSRSYENLPQLYDLVSSKLDEYEENSSILETLQLLPPDLDLATVELQKLRQEVEILGRRKRELLSGQLD